jgi:ribonuclease BN (tRNA processing enzyme)
MCRLMKSQARYQHKALVSLCAAVQTAEVAFTGDSTIQFAHLPENQDVLTAKLLIMECTFLDEAVDQAGAREKGHVHLKDIAANAHRFQVRITHQASMQRGEARMQRLVRPLTNICEQQ